MKQLISAQEGKRILIKRQGGFTLIELLVVIATTAVRMQTTNNLKQIGLGPHNDNRTNGEFPYQGSMVRNEAEIPENGELEGYGDCHCWWH